MGQLGGPIAAEAGADYRDPVRIDFAPLQHIVETGNMDLMGIGGCEHGALTRPRTVEHQTTPSFFDETFGEGVALFFPIEGNGNAREWDIEIARCREMHLAGFEIGVLFPGGAGERVSAYAIIAV